MVGILYIVGNSWLCFSSSSSWTERVSLATTLIQTPAGKDILLIDSQIISWIFNSSFSNMSLMSQTARSDRWWLCKSLKRFPRDTLMSLVFHWVLFNAVRKNLGPESTTDVRLYNCGPFKAIYAPDRTGYCASRDDFKKSIKSIKLNFGLGSLNRCFWVELSLEIKRCQKVKLCKQFLKVTTVSKTGGLLCALIKTLLSICAFKDSALWFTYR